MNFSKIVRIEAGVLALVGFSMMVLSVGSADYMDAVGRCVPLMEMLPNMLVGLVMLICGAFLFNKVDDSDYEWDEEDDPYAEDTDWEDWGKDFD